MKSFRYERVRVTSHPKGASRTVLWCSLTMFAAVHSGCDYMPSNPVKEEPVAASNLLVDEGRRCDWVFTGSRFAVPNLLDLSFVERIDKQNLLGKLVEADARKLPLNRSMNMPELDGMSKWQTDNLRTFTEPFEVASVLCEEDIPRGVRHVSLSYDGSFALAVSDTIDLWDVSEQRRVQRHANKFPDAQSVFLNRSGEHCLVVEKKQVTKFKLETGASAGTFACPTGDIVGFDYARAAEQLVVLGERGTAYLLNDDLKLIQAFPKASATPLVAIGSDAERFFLADDSSQTHYFRTDGSEAWVPHRLLSASKEKLFAFDGNTPYEYYENRLLIPRKEDRFAEISKVIAVEGVVGMEAFSAGNADWVCCIRSISHNKETRALVQDYQPQLARSSAPAILPAGIPACFEIGAEAERLALGYDDKFQVVSRRPWSYPTHVEFARAYHELAKNGRYDDLELLVDTVCALPQTYDGATGDEIRIEFARRIAIWSNRVTDANTGAELQEWWNSGSALANLAAVLHLTNAASGYGYQAYDVEEVANMYLEKLTDDSLAGTFAQLVCNLEFHDEADRQFYQPMVDIMENHPTFLLPHTYLIERLRRKHPNASEVAESYCAVVSQLYPEPRQDAFAAKIMLSYIQTTQGIHGTRSLSRTLMPGLKELLATELLTETQLQRIYNAGADDVWFASLQEAAMNYAVPVDAALDLASDKP